MLSPCLCYFGGQNCSALGAAGVQEERGGRQMLWCGALGDQGAGLSHSPSSRDDDYIFPLQQKLFHAFQREELLCQLGWFWS